MKTAAVLWTGGKDSALALHESLEQGYRIKSLVTFAPPKPKFLAHPLPLMHMQAQALGLAHKILEIQEPYETSYRKAITFLKEKEGLEALVTGDIAQVCGLPNWVKVCSESLGVEVCTPLWGQSRKKLLENLFSRCFHIIFSCVKKPWFTKEWLGKELDKNSLPALQALHKAKGLDLCGEQGEYHTLVLDSPLFAKKLIIDSCTPESLGPLWYLKINRVSLKNKIK